MTYDDKITFWFDDIAPCLTQIWIVQKGLRCSGFSSSRAQVF